MKINEGKRTSAAVNPDDDSDDDDDDDDSDDDSDDDQVIPFQAACSQNQ